MARAVTTPYLLLCEEDFEFFENTRIEVLADVLAHDSGIAGVGGEVWEPRGRACWAHDFRRICEEIVAEPSQEPIRRTARGAVYQPCQLILNFGLFRRELFQQFAWDEDLALNEHLDYYYRVSQQGGRRMAVAQGVAILHHKDRPSEQYVQFRSRDFRGLADEKHRAHLRTEDEYRWADALGGVPPAHGMTEGCATMTFRGALDDGSDLAKVAACEFPGNPQAVDLIGAFLQHRQAHCGEFVAALIALAEARSREGVPAATAPVWEVRRLAALMLQHQFLCLPTSRLDESLRFLELLGLLDRRGATPRLKDLVLEEGYTTTEPRRFLVEFRRHLGRVGRVLARLKSRSVSRRDVRDFIAASRQECCLSLARYLFQPDAVAERIWGQVRRSAGESVSSVPSCVAAEAQRQLARLPRLERGLVRSLMATRETYWVSEATSSWINALIERPIGTVVLVVKPPGSGLEIELKRAGRRHDLPLGIVYQRAGKTVPPSHRLDGGSTVDMLQFEAENAARLARIYRRVHRSDPPIPIATTITMVDSLPVGEERCEHLIDYFSDPQVFGEDFPSMHKARKQATAAFVRERGRGMSGLGGAWGETVEFLQYAVPAQSMLVGTSSFRLDRLCRYLSPDGARYYFEEGLKVKATRGEARRFADTLLHEALGASSIPRIAYESHEAYLAVLFARSSIRARADQVHASMMRQLGTFWGSVLALRAYSDGESFVARNVGLKTCWDRGRWRVRLIFMDHDNLRLPPSAGDDFNPVSFLAGSVIDETHVTGPPQRRSPLCGALDHLRFIYRPDDRTTGAHWLLFRDSMRRAYRKTQRRLSTSPALKRLIAAEFVAHSQAWDEAVRIFLRRRRDDDGAGWREAADALLAGRGLTDRARARYLKSIEDFASFLERLSFLYLDEPSPGSTQKATS
jgi:hypothetical protein